MKHCTYSELLYLYADKHVKDRAKLVNYDRHPSGEKLPVKRLAQDMTEAAVAYLVQHGYIRLSVRDVKKLFILPAKDVFIETLKDADAAVSGIEAGILSNIQSGTTLKKAVYGLLSADETVPWGHVIALSKASLAEKHILTLEEKAQSVFSVRQYRYDPALVAGYASAYQDMCRKVEEFSRESPYPLVVSAVKNGIAARQEHSSSDD